MEFNVGDVSIGGIGLNVGSLIFSSGVAWAIVKKSLENVEEKIKKHEQHIDKLFDLRDKHEDEANKERLLLHQNISKLEGMLEFRGRENIEIMKRVEKIDNNIEDMKNDLAYLKVENKREG